MPWRSQRAPHQVRGRFADLEVLSIGRRPADAAALAREQVDLGEVSVPASRVWSWPPGAELVVGGHGPGPPGDQRGRLFAVLHRRVG